METKADEPEHEFLLEEKVVSLLLFTSWTVRNLKLKGQTLYNVEDDGETLHTIASLADSISKKIPPLEGKEFPFTTHCHEGTVYTFNAISEDAREKAIAIFNFASRSAKWFYPFEELHYKDHATLEVIGKLTFFFSLHIRYVLDDT